MFKKGYKMSDEHKKRIGEANKVSFKEGQENVKDTLRSISTLTQGEGADYWKLKNSVDSLLQELK